MKFQPILAPNDDRLHSRPRESADSLASITEARGLRADESAFVVEYLDPYGYGYTVRRVIFLSLDKARAARRRAQARGRSTRPVVAHLVPVNERAEAAGWVSEEFAFLIVLAAGRDRFPIEVYRTLEPARGAVRAAVRHGYVARIVFCYLAPVGELR